MGFVDFLKSIFGSKSDRDLREIRPVLDSILAIYPELEKVPPKFAILHRNRYMIDKADIVITYIQYTKGGAYQAYLYAKKQGKNIIELQTENFPLS